MAVDHRLSRSSGMPGETGDRRSSRGGDVIPGSLAALDITLPPTPLKDLLAADGASVFVFSADAELVNAVRQAGGEQYPVSTVEDWPQLMSAVVGGRCNIVLLDADAIPAGLDQSLDELHSAVGTLVVLAAAKREDAPALMELLSDRRIHRLLIKPAALGITRLLLESAVSRYLQLRDTTSRNIPLPMEPLRHRAGTAPRRWPALMLATALVSSLLGALLVGGITRFGASNSESSPLASVEPIPAVGLSDLAPAQPAALGGQGAADLSTAEQDAPAELARAEGRPTESADADAAVPLARAAEVTTSTDAVTRLSTAPPPPPPRPQAAEPQPPTELESLLATGRARLERGQLLVPEGDSAMNYLDRAAALSPNDPAVLELRMSLAAAVAASARVAIDKGDLDGATALAGQAFGLGADRQVLTRLDLDLDAARQAELTASAARRAALDFERRQAQYLATPAPAGTLRLLESQPPEYPEDALRLDIEGWVELEFIVGTDGRTRAITVLDEQPRTVFGDAAVTMVAAQRYEPFRLDGRTYERLVRLRVSFVLE